MMGSNLAFDTEGLVARQLEEDAQAALDRRLAGPGDGRADAEITVGDDALAAVRRFDWNGDELFVLASGGGVLRRVFLGDMTYKLVRATPVPGDRAAAAHLRASPR